MAGLHPKRHLKSVLLLCGLALALALLAAVLWARFQVSQRSGWVATAWDLGSRGDFSSTMQTGLDTETRANKNIVAQYVHVVAPDLGLDESFVSGPNARVNDGIRVASNIKPFISAAILKLIEQGSFGLDAPIGPFLTARTRETFTKAGRDVDAISVRQLLNHSSGLADYGNSKLFQLIAYVPTAYGLARHWTAQEQIWFAANMTPAQASGSQFEYSDTNYLLLAEILTKAAGETNRGIALRKILDWSALGANETYWEAYEAPPGHKPLAQHFRGSIEDTKLDVSFDQHGGGGLIMSVKDLAQAHRAVVMGAVFKDPGRMTVLMVSPGTAQGSGTYGLGISKISIEGEACYTHGGRWGTNALTCPDIDLTIARSWGQSNAGPDLADANGLAAVLVRTLKEKRVAP